MHPNLIRVASVVIFFAAWEILGCEIDPIFLASPTAILGAANELIWDGSLLAAMKQTLLPFMTGLFLTIVIGITLGIAMAQWPLVEWILDLFVVH